MRVFTVFGLLLVGASIGACGLVSGLQQYSTGPCADCTDATVPLDGGRTGGGHDGAVQDTSQGGALGDATTEASAEAEPTDDAGDAAAEEDGGDAGCGAVDTVANCGGCVGKDIPCREVRLDYPEPPHSARYAEIVPSAAILFGQPLAQIAVDAAIMGQKLSSLDPVAARVAERQCATNLSPSFSPEGLLAKVRRILEAKPGRYPGPEQLADALQTSPRTLRRSLDEMGTSYQALVDMARCKHATDLLTATDMSVNEIAERLGFSEGRALRRAFKRWTGSTAAKYRLEKGVPPSSGSRAHR